jgi:hypothetical protein
VVLKWGEAAPLRAASPDQSIRRRDRQARHTRRKKDQVDSTSPAQKLVDLKEAVDEQIGDYARRLEKQADELDAEADKLRDRTSDLEERAEELREAADGLLTGLVAIKAS